MSVAAHSQGVIALAGQYGFENAGRFVIEHIDALRQAESVLANRCGEVLELAVTGFGVGSETGLILIGLGQALLGNPPVATSTVAVATNPVVMTCAAIGAIHYGWNALNDAEREAILSSVSGAFAVGAELIRSLAKFTLETIAKLLSRENLEELKAVLANVAMALGTSLSQITRAIGDRAHEAVRSVSNTASWLVTAAWDQIPSIRSQNSTS